MTSVVISAQPWDGSWPRKPFPRTERMRHMATLVSIASGSAARSLNTELWSQSARICPGKYVRLALLLAFVLMVIFFGTTRPAVAERVALVIGNSDYMHTQPLTNPGNDAADMASVLRGLDFKVVEGINLDKKAFSERLERFGKATDKAEVTLFFYAGHGLQVDGKNYLVPIDARLEQKLKKLDLRRQTIDLDAVMENIRGKYKLVFLDACRDNPLTERRKRTTEVSRTEAAMRGLAEVRLAPGQSGRGTLIGYATKPGGVADDGGGRNSPFTAALLTHIKTPGLSVQNMLIQVTDSVMVATKGQQEPWSHSSLRDVLYLNPVITGERFQDCTECPWLVVVPAGSYTMGQQRSEKVKGKRFRPELPEHKVTIEKKFAVGIHEVTFWQWDICYRTGGCSHAARVDKGWGRGNLPVIGVSWRDAKEYVGWLSRKTGQEYRLLSEAEWEYVARARTKTGPFHTGSRISTELANYDGRQAGGLYRGRTVDVDFLAPNPFGLHGMHGNVREWVEDCWHSDYHGAPENGRAWILGGNCEERVLRDGSWRKNHLFARVSYRKGADARRRLDDAGFRVARTLK